MKSIINRQEKLGGVLRGIPAYAADNGQLPFTGPALYFHRRAIGLEGNIDFEQRIEYTYAALTAWGMHRMGNSGPTMKPYTEFRDSINHQKGALEKLSQVALEDWNESHWNDLKTIFLNLEIMQSTPILVAHSKVLAHLLPEHVMPIDRRYTLNFLYHSTSDNHNPENSWLRFREIQEFMRDVLQAPEFKQHFPDEHFSKVAWNTSRPKIVDNVIIGIAKRL